MRGLGGQPRTGRVSAAARPLVEPVAVHLRAGPLGARFATDPAGPARRATAPRVGGPGRVLVVTGSVGQGHDGASRELARRLRARGVDVEVRDYLDALPLVARWGLRHLYGPVVQHAARLYDGILDGLEAEGPVLRTVEALCRTAEDDVAAWALDADLVVSTYPLASRTLGDLRASGRLGTPAATYLTDPSVHAVWCHPAVDHHLTVTTATVLDAARYGVRAVASGPLCAPAHRPADGGRSRARVRRSLGLPDAAPVVLISAGSFGMGDVRRTVRDLLVDRRTHVVVLCGRNARLRRRLSRLPRVAALAWRDDVPALMAAADVLVHNAGGLSLTEALALGLPVVTYRPIPGHGRANAVVLEDAGIAPWPRTAPALAATVRRLVGPDGARCAPAAGDHWPRGADPADAVAALLAAVRASSGDDRDPRRTRGAPQPLSPAPGSPP